MTYEFGPQGENGSGLRAAALLALAELDPDLAETHAVHLLGDRRTEQMSGEPALTAVRFLAARGSTGPLYLYALQGSASQDGAPGTCSFARFVREWALQTRQLDAQAVATRRTALIETLREAAELSGDPGRRKLLTDALLA